MSDRGFRLLAGLLLLMMAAGGVVYFKDMASVWQLVGSEQAKTTELSAMRRKDIPVREIGLEALLRDRARYVVVDVREREEFSQARIRGAINYRLGEILQNPAAREALMKQVGDRIPVFYCHDGERSQLAAEKIRETFGGTVYYMKKGYKQIRRMPDPGRIWGGSLVRLLPPGHEDQMRLWMRKWQVPVDTLIDLSMHGHERVQGLEGKRFIHAPILLMSDRQIEDLIQSLDDQPVVALCNSKVSCFSTEILRYRLEEHGRRLAGFVRLIKEDVTHLPGI